MPTPVKTKPTTPVREQPKIDPERFYNPERLCPGQRGDGERFSRP